MALILVIDDEPDVLDSICEILQEGGYKTLKAKDGEKGLEMAKKNMPDLIICDVRMPEGNEGFEVLEKLRKEEPASQIPFIFLTMRDRSEDIVRGIELGAQDYLSKASEGDEILARVKTHLELKAAREKLAIKNEELKKKNKELERLNHLLESANKLIEGYQQFASERFNDRLTVIIGQIKMLKDKYGGDIDTLKRLETIDRSCGEILDTVENFRGKIEKRGNRQIFLLIFPFLFSIII